MRRHLCSALALATSLITVVPSTVFGEQQGSAAVQVTAIVGASVVDLEGGDPIHDAVVLVRGDRISAVGPAASTPVPRGVEVVRADGMWLVPGLMNMHVHFGLKLPGAAGAALANETEAELALRMAASARESLRAGVTTVRLTGERGHVDLALKRAIERGETVGPRIFSSGRQVQVTGGHGSDVGEVANDGPAEFREAVRLEIRAGASWIKLAISGGIATPGGDISASFMTVDEIEAVTDIAHRHGVMVTAHSGSPTATRGLPFDGGERDLVRPDDPGQPAGHASVLRAHRFARLVPRPGRIRREEALGRVACGGRSGCAYRSRNGPIAP